MVLRILKEIAGAGVSVNTVLAQPGITPGGTLAGEVRFTGGDVDLEVQRIELDLAAGVLRAQRESERLVPTGFFQAQVCGPFRLAAGGSHAIPFTVTIPWETPLTAMGGRPITGMELGVATELALSRAFDKTDHDALTVEPLPVQAEALRAIEAAGFQLQGGKLVDGTYPGSHMPFYQEIEFWSTGEFTAHFKKLSVTFFTGAETTEVVFQADNLGTLLTPGVDVSQRFTVRNNVPSDFTELVRQQLWELVKRRTPGNLSKIHNPLPGRSATSDLHSPSIRAFRRMFRRKKNGVAHLSQFALFLYSEGENTTPHP
ncbi:MAG TPA: sporulation protein [Stackebrandtia sp.]|uniref:sporulation protein n=1 Tax=Stackebrandtia sp. TaxID=2023065 RepID=UPI002D6F8857|nr:sporulation protein [Stackebrandtia sp.]HZE38735.1 sporulation protein [Stackebrandtia sp.]